MTQSRPLTYDEFLAEAMPRFRQVFESRDAFGAPFRPDVPRRVILYQEFLYSLDDEQFAGLTTAAKSVGDTKIFEFATEVTVTAAMVAGRSLDPRHELLYESDPAYMLAGGREALVTARVETDGGKFAALLEVAIAPTPLTNDESIA